MKTIWKFPVDFTSAIEMPAKAKIVHVGLDPQGTPCIWGEVDSDTPKVTRRFETIGTGHKIPDGGQHVGSFTARPFVWHVYEVTQ